MDRSLLAENEGLPWSFSTGQHRKSLLSYNYNFVFISFTYVDNMAKARNNVDVDASKLIFISTRLQCKYFGMTLIKY